MEDIINKIKVIHPILDGCDTHEPSIEDVVFGYYCVHFNVEKAHHLTDEYFSKLLAQIGS